MRIASDVKTIANCDGRWKAELALLLLSLDAVTRSLPAFTDWVKDVKNTLVV